MGFDTIEINLVNFYHHGPPIYDRNDQFQVKFSMSSDFYIRTIKFGDLKQLLTEYVYPMIFFLTYCQAQPKPQFSWAELSYISNFNPPTRPGKSF